MSTRELLHRYTRGVEADAIGQAWREARQNPSMKDIDQAKKHFAATTKSGHRISLKDFAAYIEEHEKPIEVRSEKRRSCPLPSLVFSRSRRFHLSPRVLARGLGTFLTPSPAPRRRR